MYPPHLIDELARIFAEAALERLLAETAVPSRHQEQPCNPQSDDRADSTIIDAAASQGGDCAKDDNITQYCLFESIVSAN